MSLRVAVIVNPAAGHGRSGRLWPDVAREMRGLGLHVEASLTAGVGDATGLAAQAERSGYDTIVAVGGDGTVNEVVNGMFIAGGGSPHARLGVISTGTGCDFVRCLGVPPGLPGVPYLKGETRLIDVGIVRHSNSVDGLRYFVNVGDVGLGAEAAARVNKGSKRLGGFLSFLVGAVVSISRFQFKWLECTIDGESVADGKLGLVVVANGTHFAGGMHVAPEASLDDGLFDVAILDEITKLDLTLDVLPRVYQGTHLSHPRISYRKARTVSIVARDTAEIEVDGEVLGHVPAEFSLLRRALRVAAPMSDST